VVASTLRLDGEACSTMYWQAFTASSPGPTVTIAYPGWWSDGTGTKFKAFKFGAPSEEATTNQTEGLKIEIEMYLVVKTENPYVRVDRGPPSSLEKNRVKKPFQPNVGVGNDVPATTTFTLSKHQYERTHEPAVYLSLKYSTAIGLEVRDVISYKTHPHLFDEFDDRRDEDDADEEEEKPKVKREAPGDDARGSNKKIKGGSSRSDPIDLTL